MGIRVKLTGSGKVKMGASPSGSAPIQEASAMDTCSSHYKSHSEEWCHVSSKVPFPGNPLHIAQKSPLSYVLGDKGKDRRQTTTDVFSWQ